MAALNKKKKDFVR